MKNNQKERIPDGGKMVSSIDLLYNLMFEKRGRITFEDFQQAKDNYMQELKHAYEAEQNNCRGIFKYENFEHYYRENYGK